VSGTEHARAAMAAMAPAARLLRKVMVVSLMDQVKND